MALSNLANQKTMYTFGGGTIGDVWQRNPITGEYELRPQFRGVGPAGQRGLTGRETTGLKNQKEVYVIPAGMSNKQEYRWMKEEAKQKGIPYVEAPEKWTRKTEKDGEDGFYNARGQKFSGTLMGTGSYGGFGGGKPQSSQRSWDNYVERVGPRNPDYIARSGFRSMDSGGGPQPAQRPAPQRTPTPRILPMPSGSYMSDQYGSGYSRQPLGFTGSPISFTAAGPRAGMGPSSTALSTPPPFPELPNYSSLMGFGGYPMLPYANY